MTVAGRRAETVRSRHHTGGPDPRGSGRPVLCRGPPTHALLVVEPPEHRPRRSLARSARSHCVPTRNRPGGRHSPEGVAAERGRYRDGVRLDLRYGSDTLRLFVPEGAPIEWVAAGDARGVRGAVSAGMTQFALEGAWSELERAGFAEAVRGRRLLVLWSDGTRPQPDDAYLARWVRGVRLAGEICVLIATGTHAPDAPPTRAVADRLGRVLSEAGVAARVAVHDCAAADLAFLGRTRRGTPLLVDRRLAEAQVVLVHSDVKHHYFAGYSNPVKFLLPGVAGREAVRANHALALEPGAEAGRHPWHHDPQRRCNPLADDMVEAAERILGGRPAFAITTVGGGGRPPWLGGGRLREVTARAFVEADRRGTVRLTPAARVVIGTGGAPFDESLYVAQRALELTRAALLPRAEVLWVARCGEGLGPAGTRERFVEPMRRPLAEILSRPPEPYQLYAHKPVKLARYLSHAGRVFLTSELDPELVRGMHLVPCRDPQELLDRWLEEHLAGRVLVIEDAARTLVLPAAGARANGEGSP